MWTFLKKYISFCCILGIYWFDITYQLITMRSWKCGRLEIFYFIAFSKSTLINLTTLYPNNWIKRVKNIGTCIFSETNHVDLRMCVCFNCAALSENTKQHILFNKEKTPSKTMQSLRLERKEQFCQASLYRGEFFVLYKVSHLQEIPDMKINNF